MMSKIELVGVVDDKIYIEIANAKVGALGIDNSTRSQQLQAQNAIAPSASSDRRTTPSHCGSAAILTRLKRCVIPPPLAVPNPAVA